MVAYLDGESSPVLGSPAAGDALGVVALDGGHEAGLHAGLGELAKDPNGPQHRGLCKLGKHAFCDL